jgi:hypothetical protein
LATEQKQVRVTKRPKRGRPSQVPEAARSNRVVTFVTNRELESLEQIAYEEDRSLSAVVHRIVVQHLENIRLSENRE